MAQFHFDVSNKDRAETILRWLFNSMRGGELPEWLVPAAVVRRYSSEQRQALERQQAPESAALEHERARQLAQLERAERDVQGGSTIAAGGTSLWAHLETLRALKKAGHIDRWEADSAKQSPQPDLTGS
jgi:hypothetical protein